MALDKKIQDLIDKINAGKHLSREEELLYFTEVMGYTKSEAENLIAIAENDNPNLIID
jgi:hypothetical protein